MTFQRTFIRRTFELGWPELWTLRVGGETLACRYNMRYGSTIYCYGGGMIPHKAGVGVLCHYFGIRAAIQSGAAEYDFMLGRQPHKLSLSNGTRELVTLRIARNSVKERLRQAVCGVFRRVKRLRPSQGTDST